MDPIYIHKGDSTIFADVQKFLTFSINTELDLTGWKAEFKTWLAENKPTIFYPLATPIEESVVLPEVQTQLGTNILDINTEIQPSNVEITYLSKGD